MGTESLSYLFTIDAKTAELTKADSILEKLDTHVDKAGDAAKKSETEFERLTKRLRQLEEPGKLAELRKKIKDLENPPKEVGRQFKGVGEEIAGAREKLGGFLEFTGAFLAFEAIKRVTEAVVDLGRELVNAAAEHERLNLAMSSVFGKDAGYIMAGTEKISGFTEFDDDVLNKFALRLKRAGAKTDEINTYLSAITDVAAMAGDKGAADQAVYALEKAIFTGRTEARSLQYLGVGYESLRALPKYAGLSDAALKKKYQEGSLSVNDLLNVIAGEDHKLGDQGLKIAGTMGSLLGHLSDLPGNYFKLLDSSPAFQETKGKLTAILEELDPGSDRGREIFAALEGAIGKLVDQFAQIDIKHVADVVTEDVIPALGKMFDAIGPVVDAVETIGRILSVVSDAIHGLNTLSSGGLVDAVKGYATTKGGIGDKFVGFFNGGLNALASTWEKYFASGDKIADGLAAGIGAGTNKVKNATSDIGKASVSSLQSTLDIHSPSRVFEDLGAFTVAGFVSGVRKGRGAVDDVMSGAFAVPVLPASGGPAGAARVNVSIGDIVVHARGASTDEQAKDAAEQVRESIVGELVALFEHIQGKGPG